MKPLKDYILEFQLRSVSTELDGITYTDESMENGIYWFDPEPPFNDFNKDIVDPGENETYPDGVVGIRADDDFWQVAAFPYEYKDLPIEEIVFNTWPKLFKEATFHPDSIRYEGNNNL